MDNSEENKKYLEENHQLLKRRIKVVDKGLSPEAKAEIWLKIESAIHSPRRIAISLFLRYAAVAAILFAVSYYVYTDFSSYEEIDYNSILANTQLPDDTSDNVLLILGDKDKIEIKENNVQVSHDEHGNMRVNQRQIDLPELLPREYNQLIVPHGKTTCITLSDGSKIWANSGTRLVYPIIFTSDKREVYVEGEIYLEVARNEKQPFVVKTDMMEVNVLGTSFDVSAYKDDNKQFVALATGSVEIKAANKKNLTAIKPNQLYTLEHNTFTTRVRDVDIYEYVCWKDGFLIFHNESLADVLKKIERYYNIALIFNPIEISKVTVSGKLDLKSDIRETFQIISVTAPIEYEKEGDTIRISVKH